MTEPSPRPLFSVIIPTRNRASLFAVALQSVLDQRFREFEVIVVNDGSSEEHAPRYRDILEAVADRARLLTLVHTERGHGQSYALNFGAAHAHGDYLCFLDDDDQWTDPEHLGRVAAVIAAGAERIDLDPGQPEGIPQRHPDRARGVDRGFAGPPERCAGRDRRLHRNGGGATALPGPLPPEHHHRVARLLSGDRRAR